jgi:transposase-like protein
MAEAVINTTHHEATCPHCESVQTVVIPCYVNDGPQSREFRCADCEGAFSATVEISYTLDVGRTS